MDEVTRQLALIQFGVFAKSPHDSDVRAICQFMVSALEGKESVEAMRRVIQALEPFCSLRPGEAANGEGPESAMRGLCASVVAQLKALCVEDTKRSFIYYPEIKHEVRGTSIKGEVVQGHLGCTYGTSLYEFHYEYPIEGAGCAKDSIIVLIPGSEPVPIFDYCREDGLVVVCNRCGEEITYTCDFDCGRFR